MTIEVDIETALMKAAEAVAAIIGLPIELPNRKIFPPTNSDGVFEHNAYLRATHFHNPNQNLAWGDETLFQGILQIDVLGPPDMGSLPFINIGGSLSTRFAKGTQFRSGSALVEIQEKPSVLTPVTDGHETFVPVSIRYQCFG